MQRIHKEFHYQHTPQKYIISFTSVFSFSLESEIFQLKCDIDILIIFLGSKAQKCEWSSKVKQLAVPQTGIKPKIESAVVKRCLL